MSAVFLGLYYKTRHCGDGVRGGLEETGGACGSAGEVVMNAEYTTETLEEAILPHVPVLYSVSLGLTHNPLLAEHLAARTLEQALQDGIPTEGIGSIKSWLLTLLRRTYVRELEPEKAYALECEPVGLGMGFSRRDAV